MYLKSIEVHGFKSFANKILFQFHDGITGIVGPNGSGKSNVGDAVRWVLGEQSAKQLRGNNMQDVIFSGTQTRKPMGFAYVAITLDNSDHKLPIEFEEVTVARRVYRSGESEYLINKSSCRLRDIQDLFLDTGIGKEGYSIIGQGQIDRIVSGKPEERRELFDEAVGIVKFKKRKGMAEKDLEIERQNLSRVSDILSEIEKQIEPLEKQSAVAREYLKYKEELKNLEINQFLLEYEKNKAAKAETDEKIVIAEGNLNGIKTEYTGIKEEYEKLETELEIKNQTIEEKKNRKNELVLSVSRLEGEIKLFEEQINAISQGEIHYKERLYAIKEDLASKQKELNQHLESKRDVDEKLDVMDEVQSEAAESLEKIRENIVSLMQDIESCNSEIIRYLNDDGTVKTNIQRYEMIQEQNSMKRAELNQHILTNKSEEAVLTGILSKCRNALEGNEKKIAEKNANITKIEEELASEQKEREEKNQTLLKKQQEYLTINAKLDSLKNLTERYDGYGNSIRRVMEQKNVTPGILGVVADIIKVDKNYETAIETALGGNIQNIVTDNEVTAKELIGFLKRNKFGRATFLPLNSISGNKYNNAEVLKEKGVLGLASSLVKADAIFQRLLDNLLGRILVVDHIDNAIALAKRNNYSLRIVTLDGEQLNPGGSLSGGAYRNSSNLLGRKREIAELTKEAELLLNETEHLKEELEELRLSRNRFRCELEQKKEELQGLHMAQNTERLKLEQEEARFAGIQSAFSRYVAELGEMEKQQEELSKNLDILKLSLDENLTKSRAREIRLEECRRLLEAERETEKKALEQVSSLRLEFSNLEQGSQYTLEHIKRIKGEIEKLSEDEASIIISSKNSMQQKTEREENITAGKNMIEENKKALEKIEADIAALLSEKEAMNVLYKGFFTKREELARLMNELDKELFRLMSQLEKLTEQMDAGIGYLWEEYELTPSVAASFQDASFNNFSQNKKQIGDLKNKIKNLGDVNVNAIEDFKNLKERYEFLKTQHDDLERSERTLIGIIMELDEEMRRQFLEKFEQIKEQFDIVFKELFGGGKGTLELTEDEDILEAGIRIIAQPPGKKLQNMMQLSGGEKALTAISLLFAIQNLKPSPFCLLDEIEAALDDSNVKRFADYLHKLTKDTQFIIITHRRGTMGAADILYGITMQEKGISTLVSVNLIEDELDK